MIILHCIYTLGGGGAERQLAYLASMTAESGVDVHVAYFKGGPNLSLLQESKAVLHALPVRKMYDPRMLLDIYRLVRRLRPQIIQTWLTQMDILAGLAARVLNVPVVLSERSSSICYPLNIRNILRDHFGRKAAAIIANSEGGREYWRDKHAKGVIRIIRNGIPLEVIARTPPCTVLPVGDGLALTGDQKLVLYAGRYGEEKNPGLLLEAFSRALEQRKDAVAVMFGDGPLRPALVQSHALLPNRDRIHILAYTDSLWGYMKRADLVVSMSSFEGNPNVVLEAAAAGCPLLVSDISGHREILDDETARFVPVSDVAATADAIVDLLVNSGEAAGMAARGLQRVQEWSLQRAANECLDLYHAILRANNTWC